MRKTATITKRLAPGGWSVYTLSYRSKPIYMVEDADEDQSLDLLHCIALLRGFTHVSRNGHTHKIHDSTPELVAAMFDSERKPP